MIWRVSSDRRFVFELVVSTRRGCSRGAIQIFCDCTSPISIEVSLSVTVLGSLAGAGTISSRLV